MIVLALIFTLALAVRLYLLPLQNDDDDIFTFLIPWTERALKHGVWMIYDLGSQDMHPPLNYYLLWMSGKLYQAFFAVSPGGALDPPSLPLMMLIKLPNLICDLLIGLIVFLAVLKRTSFGLAVTILCLYLFNPAIIWEAAFVGQFEAIQTIFILLAVVLLYVGKVEISWAALALAALTKPQGLILIPLIGFASLLMFPASRLLRAGMAALAVTFVVLLPWILSGRMSDIFELFGGFVDSHPWITLNAANLWALVSSIWDQGFQIGSGDVSGTVLFDDGEPLQILPFLTYKQVGLALFAIAYAFALTCIIKRRDGMTLLLTAAFVFFAFFMLPTQMTERYLFPFFPLFAITLMQGPLPLYVAASATFMLNLYLVFPLPDIAPWNVTSIQYPPLYDFLAIADGVRRPLTVALSLANIGLLTWFSGFLFRRCFLQEPDTDAPGRRGK